MLKYLLAAVAAVVAGAYAYTHHHANSKESTVAAANSTTNSATSKVASDATLSNSPAPGVDPEKVDWSQVDWKTRLTPEEFHILREAGTERAFTGEYWNTFNEGQYNCKGCGLPLFKSDAKFDSHCGWPSFDEAINKDAIVEIPDDSYGMHRVEVRCRRCGAHLGHIFDDGPTATGMRYCINSPSIKFVPRDATNQESKKEEPTK
jgi:peptide-methionine (R)-S-oxide reductase